MKENEENLDDEEGEVETVGGKLGKELNFDEAAKIDALNKQFVKLLTNIRTIIGVRKWWLGEITKPDYNDKKKTVTKVVLRLWLDYIDGHTKKPDGTPLDQKLDVTASKFRKQLEPYCNDGSITKYLFSVKPEGEGTDRIYILAVAGPKPNTPSPDPGGRAEGKREGAIAPSPSS